MQVQIKKIEVDKWCEGCKIQDDPGQEYVIDWIEHHGQWFRNAYEASCCKGCRNWSECGHNVVPQCDSYCGA